MKRLILLMLLLAVALSAAACGPVSGTGDASPPPEDSQAVPAVPETEVWTRQHRSVWGSEPVTVSADFERISGAASHGMTAGQELLLLDFMDCYYQSVTRLQVIDCTDLFTDRAQSDYHRTVWRTLAEIRLRAPIDLHAGSYSYSLRCTDLTQDGDTAELTLLESSVVYFNGLNGLPSEQWNVQHTFRLQRITGDRWRIASHDSDDNPYYSADYDPATDTDRHLPQLLACIEARESGPRELWTPPVTWDHDYDRAAALDYMLTYSAQRNPAYKAYDDLGGNCMNFGSQVLTAGGIPALPGGYRDGWFYNSERSVSLPWVNVGGFLDRGGRAYRLRSCGRGRRTLLHRSGGGHHHHGRGGAAAPYHRHLRPCGRRRGPHRGLPAVLQHRQPAELSGFRLLLHQPPAHEDTGLE